MSVIKELLFAHASYNLTNKQRFTGVTGFGLAQDPFLGGAPSEDFGKFSATQTPLNETRAGRVIQFALRLDFYA